MPKAAVHKHDDFSSRHHYIRVSGKTFSVQAIAITQAEKHFSDCHFGSRIR